MTSLRLTVTFINDTKYSSSDVPELLQTVFREFASQLASKRGQCFCVVWKVNNNNKNCKYQFTKIANLQYVQLNVRHFYTIAHNN